MGTFSHELCKNSLTDRLAVLVVDSGRPKEAQVQSYLLLPVCPHGRNLANTIEPSVWCSDAAVCQITLSACYQ